MSLNTQDIVLDVKNVSKEIGERRILEHVDLSVQSGQMCGISGHNGAGKSILLRVISGLVRPSEGSVRVFGDVIGEAVEFPRMTGAMIDGPGFLPHYSGFKNLQLLAMIQRQVDEAEIAETIRRVGLDPQDKRPVRTYSTGMRQRLGLAQAIMERPRLLLLDEPTSAIDRAGTEVIHQLLKALNAEGVTIVLTSHSQEELSTLCDTIVYMERGQMRAA